MMRIAAAGQIGGSFVPASRYTVWQYVDRSWEARGIPMG